MVDLVLHTGHTSKHFNISHSVHIAICPQLQNKTFGKLVRHITQSSFLKVCLVVLFWICSFLK